MMTPLLWKHELQTPDCGKRSDRTTLAHRTALRARARPPRFDCAGGSKDRSWKPSRTASIGASNGYAGWAGYSGAPGVTHDPHIVGRIAADIVLPCTHRVIASLKRWALGVYRGLTQKHLQTYLDGFVFRCHRRRARHAAFRSLLGIAAMHSSLNYKILI
jgi:ISXO2-like transposase domain